MVSARIRRPLLPDALLVAPAQTVWGEATAAITRQFSRWRGCTIAVTAVFGYGARRTRPHTVVGWIDYVTSAGFGFAWPVRGAWGQADPSILRTFFAWTDVWAQDGHVEIAGTMIPATSLGEPIDVGYWVRRWRSQAELHAPSAPKRRRPTPSTESSTAPAGSEPILTT